MPVPFSETFANRRLTLAYVVSHTLYVVGMCLFVASLLLGAYDELAVKVLVGVLAGPSMVAFGLVANSLYRRQRNWAGNQELTWYQLHYAYPSVLRKAMATLGVNHRVATLLAYGQWQLSARLGPLC